MSFGHSASTGYETALTLFAALAEAHPGISTGARLLPTAEILVGVADGSLDLFSSLCILVTVRPTAAWASQDRHPMTSHHAEPAGASRTRGTLCCYKRLLKLIM
ncbi:hypothetical protein [Streptomyces sp. 2131.1]|uniref:hypothetical protein n=1 Tax=Streptomyces sp. 2131.1 TaxID=1855346 RepID=UPI001C40AD69|nr:hypothetical protein [Streptomyces sp. 2131.1]